MSNINFTDLVDALKKVEKAEVKESIFHKDGVYRETVIEIVPYTVTIEYVEFGRHQVPLKFCASKEGQEPVYFKTIKDLCDTIGISVNDLKGIDTFNADTKVDANKKLDAVEKIDKLFK